MELLVNMERAIVKSGRSRKEIANELGITYNNLWKLLSGNRGVKAVIVARLASILGTTPNDLFGDVANYSIQDNIEQKNPMACCKHANDADINNDI